MARIRTIKPEFPQSETIGKLSREARLLFILLWTIADDDGRTRAAPRMLASLLYPYDDDAPGLIEGWLAELSGECIIRYESEGSQYLKIAHWLKHQKIDHPSKSKLPPPPGPSPGGGEGPTLARVIEASDKLATDLGEDQDQDHRGGGGARASLISSEASEIADDLAQIAGHDPKFLPPGWCGAALRVQAWLDQAWPRDAMISGAKAAMASKRDGPPSTVTYFEKPIARMIVQQSAPVPIAEVRKGDASTTQNAGGQAGWQRARDDFRSAHKKLKLAANN